MKRILHIASDWIIKKLGGYTEKDLFDVRRSALYGAAIAKRDVECIRARVQIARPGEISRFTDDFIKRQLARQLIPLVMERVEIRKVGSNYCDPEIAEYEAMVSIVVPNKLGSVNL